MRLWLLLLATATATAATAATAASETRLAAFDGAAGDRFGAFGDVSGDTVVIGTERGSVYVFERGVFSTKLPVNNITAVAIDGDTIVVGAAAGSGAAAPGIYVFERPWAAGVLLTADAAESVAVHGDVIVANSRDEVRVFERNGSGTWAAVKAIPFAERVWYVAVEGDTVVISTGAAAYTVRKAGDWGAAVTLFTAAAPPAGWYRLSIAIHGGVIVVGDASGGAVHVFDGGAGQVLSPPPGGENLLFGWYVAISDDVVAVGVPWYNSAVGAAVLFRRADWGGTAWVQGGMLAPSDSGANGRFGSIVAISGHAVLSCARRVNNDTGAVYLYDVSGDPMRLSAFDGAPDDQFGRSVSISGDAIVIGAQRDDDGAKNGGVVFVFERGGAVAKLIASDASDWDQFGKAIGIDGDTIAVSAYRADGVYLNIGAVYVFTRGASWGGEVKLTAPDVVENMEFGKSLDIDGDVIVVGAWSLPPGAVYVFTRTAGVWDTGVKLTAPLGASEFGRDVAVEGDVIVVTDVNATHAFHRAVDGVWGEPVLLAAGGGVSVDISHGVIVVGGDHIRVFEGSSEHVLADGEGRWVGISGDMIVGATGSVMYTYRRDIVGVWELDSVRNGTEGIHSIAVDRNYILAGTPWVNSNTGAATLYDSPRPEFPRKIRIGRVSRTISASEMDPADLADFVGATVHGAEVLANGYARGMGGAREDINATHAMFTYSIAATEYVGSPDVLGGTLTIEVTASAVADGVHPVGESALRSLRAANNALIWRFPDGWGQTLDLCDGRETCNGRGTCRADGVCACRDGRWWGIDCETPCACENGGICAGSFCACLFPYFGKRCQEYKDKCVK